MDTSNSFLEKVLSLFPEHIYCLDINMTVTACNIKQANFFGYNSIKEIVGKTLYELLNDNDADMIAANNIKVLETGKTLEFEEQISLANGNTVTFLSKKSPLQNDEGKIIGILGVSFDVTTAKADQKNQNIVLEKIISLMPGHVYWQNKQGVILGCNDKQAQSFGFSSSKDIVGKTPYDLLPKEQADAITHTNNQVMQSGDTLIVEEKLTFEYGDAYMLSQKVPLYDEKQNVLGILGVSFDITQQKRTEKALAEQVEKTKQAYESKSAFLATASHEIRNPIGNVIASLDAQEESFKQFYNKFYDNVDVLLAADKTEEVKFLQELFEEINEHMNQSKAESYRALNSLINLGDLHRLQIEGVKPQFEISNIEELITLSIENSTYPNKSRIHLHHIIHPSVPREVTIDYNNVYEALRVIIGNAIRFSEAGGIVKITVDISENNDKRFLNIMVQDFGIGISEAQLNHLFQVSQENSNINTSNNKYWKPSLQLPQVKMRIEASGGTLKIKSIPEKGTTVILVVPYSESESIDNKYIAEKELISTAYNILLVEDDFYARKMMQGYLQGLKHNIATASSSAEAVKQATGHLFDVIFMDITLPDKNGIETMREIQNLSVNKPIFVAVTSHAAEADIDYFLSQGFAIVLAKPVTKQILQSALNDVLAAKNNERHEFD